MAKSVLQTKEWAALRESFGWQAHRIDDIWILEKSLFLGKSFLYAPEINYEVLSTNLENFLENIKKIAKNTNSIFFRLEILDQNDEKIIEKLREKKFIKAFEEIQPEFRQIVPLDKSEEEILAGMKPKGRYNIKIAQKNNIEVKKSDNILEFYQLFLETAKRDGFSIRPKDYFQSLLEILSPQGYGELLVAYYQGKPVAAEIVTYFDGVASYLYGASSSEYRNLMAPYLLHWEIMRRAKENGCNVYDLLAVAPPDEENHKYSGITRFKQQFGGETVCLVGSYDLVFQPFWYKIFKIAEKIRRH